jgi:glucan phosphoethanolaminetransferase (alkaline phosphatase superfamily)
MPNFTNTAGGTTSFITWGALAALFAAWLVFIAWREKEKPLSARLIPLMTIVVSLLVLWGLARYGDALLHWIRR